MAEVAHVELEHWAWQALSSMAAVAHVELEHWALQALQASMSQEVQDDAQEEDQRPVHANLVTRYNSALINRIYIFIYIYTYIYIPKKCMFLYIYITYINILFCDYIYI